MINVFQPAVGNEELEAIRKVFDSKWLGKGNKTFEFEKNFAEFYGITPDRVKTVGCCTEALFQSMDLLGVGPGDQVVMPAISFVGAGNAVAACGAEPVFCDVDSRTLNPGVKDIERCITPRTKAVMILHYGGLPCDLDGITELLTAKKIPLIEDNACSVASRYKGRATGTFGKIGACSFDAMKILVTGDGGMMIFQDPELAVKAGEQIYMGLSSGSGFSSEKKQSWWEFQISSFSRRSIMNDISCVMGIEQLKKLPGFLQRRRFIHGFYSENLRSEAWLKVPDEFPSYVDSSYYFFWVQTDASHRDSLSAFLKEKGIYTTFRYFPLHRVEKYKVAASLPNTDKAADTTLCLPIHNGLSDSDLGQIVESVKAFGKNL